MKKSKILYYVAGLFLSAALLLSGIFTQNDTSVNVGFWLAISIALLSSATAYETGKPKTCAGKGKKDKDGDIVAIIGTGI